MSAEKQWHVVVRRKGTNEEVHVIDCVSERSAEKAQRGVEMQMDRERFYTTIRPKPSAPPQSDASRDGEEQ